MQVIRGPCLPAARWALQNQRKSFSGRSSSAAQKTVVPDHHEASIPLNTQRVSCCTNRESFQVANRHGEHGRRRSRGEEDVGDSLQWMEDRIAFGVQFLARAMKSANAHAQLQAAVVKTSQCREAEIIRLQARAPGCHNGTPKVETKNFSVPHPGGSIPPMPTMVPTEVHDCLQDLFGHLVRATKSGERRVLEPRSSRRSQEGCGAVSDGA